MFNLNLSGRFAGIWKNAATKKIQRMETAREFWGLIAGFVLLRVVTSFVSIFSGYAFFRVNFAGLIDSEAARIFAAVALLSVIEVITAAFLFKMFKFVFSYRWAAAAAMFVGVALFYSISFYTSTNGIALYKSDTTDQAATANEHAAAAADSVRAYYAGQVQILRANIDAITPPRWNTDREGNPQLTTQQQAAKTDLYNKILLLQEGQRAALQEVERQAESRRQVITAAADADADKYAGYVCVIMVLQLIANGVLCYLYSRIYHENNRADELTGEIKDFADNIAADTDNIIKTQIAEQYGNYLNGMQRNLIALRGNGNPVPMATPPDATAAAIRKAATATPTDGDTPTDTPTDGQADGQTDRQSHGQADGRTDRRTDKIIIHGFTPEIDAKTATDRRATDRPARYTIPVYTDSQTPTDGRANRQTDGRTGRRADGQTDGQAAAPRVIIGDGWKYCQLCGKPFQPRHATQKYCGEPCKFQACANRNGKTYTFYGVKYTPQK